MRNKGGRTVNISPVDDNPRARVVHDLNERGGTRMEALFDQNMFQMHIRRERSSAYWFAASLWGMSGLIIGGLLGAMIMFTSMRAAVPVASDAMNLAVAQERARQDVEQRHDSVTQPANPGSSQHP
jgi:hypothetical protein